MEKLLSNEVERVSDDFRLCAQSNRIRTTSHLKQSRRSERASKSDPETRTAKPPPESKGTAEPGAVPPAAAVGEVSATQGAVTAALPPAISKVTAELGQSQLNAFGREYQDAIGLPPRLRTVRQNYVVQYVQRFKDLNDKLAHATGVDRQSILTMMSGIAQSLKKMKEGKFSYGSIGGGKSSIIAAFKSGEDVNASAVDFWGMKIPEGYTKSGDVYTKTATTPTKGKQTGQKFSHTDKSVRDHSQQAVVKGNEIVITAKVGSQSTGSYSIPLTEWDSTNRGPSANPNWNRRKLVEKYSEKLNWDDTPEGQSLKERILDSQVRAIQEALNKRASAQPAPAPEAKPAAQTGEKPIIGMGGAVPQEFQPTKPMSTSVKDAALDRDRADRGLPPMMDPIRKSDPELYAQMQNVLDNDWQAADKLIARWKAKPFMPTDVDTMVLLHRRVDLKNEYAKADQEYLQANKEGRTEEAQTAKAVRDSMSERLDELDEVLGRGDKSMGTMMGRAFRARQLVMREDYTLDALERDLRSRTKRDTVTDQEMAELRKIADDWKQIADEEDMLLKAHEKNIREDQAKEIAKQAELDAKKANEPSGYVIKVAEQIVASWDKRADAARARIRERMGRTSAGVDPVVLLDVAEIGLSHLGHVGLDFVKWADAVKRDIGDWAEPYLKAAWEKTKAMADADINARKGTATVAEVKKSIGPKINILEKSRKKYLNIKPEEREKTDIHWDARKIARYFWINGIRDPMKLVDAVHQIFTEFIPNITRDEVMDAMSGYGRYTKLRTDEVSVGLRDIYGQLQQEAKLRDLSKTPPTIKPTGNERRVPSDAERRKIKQVEAKKRDVKYEPVGPEQQLRSAFQATERRLSNKIKDLQFEIDKREKIVKKKPDPVTNDKIAAMREYLTALKEIHDDVFKPADLTDAQRLDMWKERAQKWIDRWKTKLELGDVLPKKRKPDPRLDKAALELRYRKQEIHKAVLEKRIQWDKEGMNTAQRVANGILNGIRFSFFLMTGGELSAVLRQGKLSLLGHPIIAAKPLVPMFKALANEKNQFKINEEVQTRENAPLYQRDALQFTEAGVRLSTMEEMNMFRISERMLKMPVLKHLFRSLAAFQRAYTTYLNVLRADLYDALTAKYGNDPVMGAQIADFINITTGRGSASLGRRLGPGFNTILFAPRWSMSRIQFLAMHPAWRGDMRTRKMVIREYGRILAGAAAIYTLGLAAGGKIEKDPRSGGGWTIAFGNKKIDPLAGLTQFTRLIARATTGWNKNKSGKLVPMREGKKFLPYSERGKPKPTEMTVTSAIGDFGRRKLAPFPGTAVSALSGKYPGGQKFKLSDTLIQHSMPITYGDIYKIMTADEHIPANVALSLLNFFGETVQVWDEDKSRNPK